MIRQIKKKDRLKLVEVVNSNDIFKPEEKEIAIDLIDETLEIKDKDEYDYVIFIYEYKKEPVGYYCISKRYMTEGVFDLYWIVVHKNFHGKKIGKQLLEQAENFIIEQGGYLVIAETSSLPSYFATRKFYLNNDYQILTEIKDFYKPGENLVIFGKYITTERDN